MSEARLARPLGREHMPADYRISLDAYLGRAGLGGGFTPGERRVPEDFGPPQSMAGFEETYRNIIDYIVRITHRIWDERDVDYIARSYADDSRVYDDYGLQLGSGKIIADTRHTTGAFSNIQLIADEIVWAGDDQTGYHTSHRTLIRGRNDGPSKYGPATNREVDVWLIANCVALENEIFLEHVLYNASSLLSQLGLNLERAARELAAAPPAGWPRDPGTWQALRQAARPAQPLYISAPTAGFDVDAFARETFERLWNRRDYQVLAERYAPDFAFRGPTDRAFSGGEAYRGFLASLIAAFPDLELQMDEVYWMGNDRDGYLSATRWSGGGRHLGEGIYGAPTGCEAQLWGLTQQRIVDGRIVNEWLLFNELDVMMQLAAARD